MADLQARAEAAADAVLRNKRWESPMSIYACHDLMTEAALHALQFEVWRPISEADQTIGNEVLGFAVYHGKPVRFVVEWNGHNWYAGWGDAIQPTHFMPLPAPPEGEGK